eukprot:NODE_7459_length_765_cov_101.646417_g7216_i0.p1 GENE.NODE_7459_length_765_cov_101.646417_g7216_i0~~NODE_7459_length_765_cov_101.646417_g7216_i0.p1  ORF type:complete len:194 (+),score=21.27 NODE_7459_length_765_cov_101.646417_g7216_i0:109-690(+)
MDTSASRCCPECNLRIYCFTKYCAGCGLQVSGGRQHSESDTLDRTPCSIAVETQAPSGPSCGPAKQGLTQPPAATTPPTVEVAASPPITVTPPVPRIQPDTLPVPSSIGNIAIVKPPPPSVAPSSAVPPAVLHAVAKKISTGTAKRKGYFYTKTTAEKSKRVVATSNVQRVVRTQDGPLHAQQHSYSDEWGDD